MRLKSFGPLLVAFIACAAAYADSDDVPADVAAKIRTTLHQRIPELKIKKNDKKPNTNQKENNTGGELLYSNDTGSLIFAGRVLDTQSRHDLTSERWNALNAIDFNALPFDLAIKSVKGDGSRKLAVFADPFCPYCRQLEEEMKGLTNVTVYTFLYPIEALHPGASVKYVQIWCAKDRSTAWSKWLLEKVEPADTRCKGAPVDQLQKLGDKLHIDSTPTLFTVDGKRTRGAIKHNEIEQLLAQARK